MTTSSTTTPAKGRKAPGRRSDTARRRVSPPPGAKLLGQGVSAQAGQRAALILEVLAGERTPQQAAAALSVSVPYFYLLERKALQGLLQACEPQPKGPPAPSAEQKLSAVEAELARCRRECQRQAALVRATQRAVGLPPLPSAAPAKKAPLADERGGPRRRRRRPTTRALRAAQAVRANSARRDEPGQVEPEAREGSLPPPEPCAKETDHGATCR